MATVIFDLDGTLSDSTNREHFIKENKWDEFFDACGNDPVIKPVADLLAALFKANYRILIITGRPERVRKNTESWLLRNFIMYDRLYMRKDGDMRPNAEYKNEVLDSIVEPITFAVDDNVESARMFRSRGITCLQVAENKF